MRIVTRASPELLAQEMVRELVEAIAHTAPDHPFCLALSGGTAPRVLYRALATARAFPWSRVELFYGDERAVPPTHPDSNHRMVREALLDHVEIVAHPMPADTGDAPGYENLLRTRVRETRAGVPVLDLVLLGVGPDGHTASLFPGTPALEERDRLVVMTVGGPQGLRRMTVTLPLINAARRVWVLAVGKAKAAIVARSTGAAEPTGATGDLPIQRVHPSQGELVWWLDAQAAG